MSPTLAEIRIALEGRLAEEHVELTFHAWITAEEVADPEAGYFIPAPGGVPPPRIVLYRTHVQHPGNELDELLTLAHEFGHYRSFAAGQRTKKYEAVLDPRDAWPTRSTEERQLILDEEARAWIYARSELDALGFMDWAAFDKREVESLHQYRLRLDLGLRGRRW